jgi:hypothetical protein
MNVTVSLLKTREELQVEKEALLHRLSTLAAQLAALDVVIPIYDPAYVPKAINGAVSAPKPRKRSGRSLVKELFDGENFSACVLEGLRTADRPISTKDCALRLTRAKGLPDDDERVPHVANRVSAALDQLRKRSRVREAGILEDGHRKLWEISR